MRGRAVLRAAALSCRLLAAPSGAGCTETSEPLVPTIRFSVPIKGSLISSWMQVTLFAVDKDDRIAPGQERGLRSARSRTHEPATVLRAKSLNTKLTLTQRSKVRLRFRIGDALPYLAQLS